MMNREQALEIISKMPFFKTSQLEAVFPDIKINSLYRKMTRWKKSDKIIELKNGCYTSKKYLERNISDDMFIVYLANMLRYPSYVSGAYVLQMKGILTDITYPITSVTTKSTRAYSNKIGEFIYNSISPKLYNGYEKKYFKNNPVYIATTAKALFDYLYIKYFKSGIDFEEILERERLNLENLSKKDTGEFEAYCKLSKNKTLINLAKEINV